MNLERLILFLRQNLFITSLAMLINGRPSLQIESKEDFVITYIDHENEDKKLLVKFDKTDINDYLSFNCYSESETKETGKIVKVFSKSFMKFFINCENETNTKICTNKPVFEPILKESFGHDLTKIGSECLNLIETDLIAAFKLWRKKGILAPLISLCQSSGSGKSKMALELLKKHAGFYFVFRGEKDSGYPWSNSLSNELFNLIIKCNDPSESMLDVDFSKCGIGKILDFLARIICQYIRDFVSYPNSSPDSEDFEDIFKFLGTRFNANEIVTLEKCLMDPEQMNVVYKKIADGLLNSQGFSNCIKVENVASFIKQALDEPRICLEDVHLSPEIIKRCDYLKKHLISFFPFLLVIDEAQLLAAEEVIQSDTKRSLTAYEAFRRALTYIEISTNVLVMTLGTNSSTLIDLNQDIHEYSSRFKEKTNSLHPLVLSSNINIVSRDYPIHEIKLSHQLLRNPIFFKYLCTFGHALWSSLPYDSVVDQGVTKISGSNNFIFAIWMILTGMSSNPSSQESNKVVANHMAHLLEIRNETKELLVSYPSEPILARVAHELIQNMDQHRDLFEILRQKFGAIKIDKGSMAEYFGEMIVLRAINEASVSVISSDFSNDLFEICKLCPEFSQLWVTKSFVLETPNEYQLKIIAKSKELMQKKTSNEEIIKLESELKELIEEFLENDHKIVKNFPHNKNCTVSAFLKKLFGLKENVDLSNELGIPPVILDGLVNASHFIHLNKTPNNLLFKNDDIPITVLPQADDRIPDLSRNVIDSSFLTLMLIRNAGFVFPPNYYGYDFGIPVLLKDQDEPTFIGFQIKRSQADTMDNVHKMQPLLHYVKCASDHCKTERCINCINEKSIQTIYSNHISIIMSLDSESTYSEFRKNYETLYFKDANDKSKKILDKIISKSRKNSVIYRKTDNLDQIQVLPENHDYFYPIVHARRKIKDGILLSQCIWDDECIKREQGKPLIFKMREKEFLSQARQQRLFAFSIRGWENFKGLFKDLNGGTSLSGKEIIESFLDGPSFFKSNQNLRKEKLIKQISYDMNLSFIEYSDELSLLRTNGKVSIFDFISKESKDDENLEKKKRRNSQDQIDYQRNDPKSAKFDLLTSSSSSQNSDN